MKVAADAGDPSLGYENEPEPNGDRVNMGAYGNTSEATSINTYYVDEGNVSGEEDGSVWRPFDTLSEAISVVVPGDRVVVAAGSYVVTAADQDTLWQTGGGYTLTGSGMESTACALC